MLAEHVTLALVSRSLRISLVDMLFADDDTLRYPLDFTPYKTSLSNLAFVNVILSTLALTLYWACVPLIRREFLCLVTPSSRPAGDKGLALCSLWPFTHNVSVRRGSFHHDIPLDASCCLPTQSTPNTPTGECDTIDNSTEPTSTIVSLGDIHVIGDILAHHHGLLGWNTYEPIITSDDRLLMRVDTLFKGASTSRIRHLELIIELLPPTHASTTFTFKDKDGLRFVGVDICASRTKYCLSASRWDSSWNWDSPIAAAYLEDNVVGVGATRWWVKDPRTVLLEAMDTEDTESEDDSEEDTDEEDLEDYLSDDGLCDTVEPLEDCKHYPFKIDPLTANGYHHNDPLVSSC